MRAREFLSEGIIDKIGNFFRKIYERIVDAISNAINKLDFGQSTTIKIPRAMKEDEEKRKGLTGMIGYFNEHAVAYKLGLALQQAGVNVTSPGPGLKSTYEGYKQKIIDNTPNFKPAEQKKVDAEIQRAEEGSDATAKLLYKELSEAQDLKFIDVSIKHDGVESMGSGKEDVTITVKKKSTEEVIDTIKASLKLYNSASNVNVYNATFASWMNRVLIGVENPATGKNAINYFLDNIDSAKKEEYTKKIENVTGITDNWRKIKKDPQAYSDQPWYIKGGTGRENANAYITANKGYQQMRDLLFNDMWSYFYTDKNKKRMNNTMLTLLGLDGADDVYLAAGTVGKDKRTVSSRTSPGFKALYEALKSDWEFEWKFPADENTVSSFLVIKDSDGKEFVQFTVPFKEGGTFTHMMAMTQLLD
jgi:hypothetical protein